jgi:hypothetical protein
MLQPFKKLQTESTDVNRMQDTLLAVLNPIVQDKILNRIEYTVLINTTNTQIPHVLNRVPTGWSIVDMDAFADVKRVSWDKNTITLIATAPVNVKLFIF